MWLHIPLIAMCSHGVDAQHVPNSSICIYQMGYGTKEKAKEMCSNNSDKLIKPHSVQFINYVLGRSVSANHWLDYDSIDGIGPCIGLLIMRFILEALFYSIRVTQTGPKEIFKILICILWINIQESRRSSSIFRYFS